MYQSNGGIVEYMNHYRQTQNHEDDSDSNSSFDFNDESKFERRVGDLKSPEHITNTIYSQHPYSNSGPDINKQPRSPIYKRTMSFSTPTINVDSSYNEGIDPDPIDLPYEVSTLISEVNISESSSPDNNQVKPPHESQSTSRPILSSIITNDHPQLSPNPIDTQKANSLSPNNTPSTPVTPTTSSKRNSFLKAFSPLRRHRRKGSDQSDSKHKVEDDFDTDNQRWEVKANELGLSVASPTFQEKFDVQEIEGRNSKVNEEKLQDAINLHEQGRIEESTILFKELALPIKEGGQGMPLAQLLYGLCLRHGWGCQADENLAFTYLTKAASSSAELSRLTDTASTKGELTLAIFELGNSFRNGWGCEKDDVAAKTYYETAARLGDTDAMIEVAQCYLLGVGTKKNKILAAKYYRMAEKHGRSEVGNSWIWKSKYD